MNLNARIFPTTGHARVLLFMFIRRELGGKGTGCLFQFTYCEFTSFDMRRLVRVFADQNKTSIMIYNVQYNNLFSVMTMLSKCRFMNR